jgi:Domain of unknown function (DUF4426)
MINVIDAIKSYLPSSQRSGEWVFRFMLLALLLMPHAANAQFIKSGNIRVYASAVVSNQINSETAREHGITRSASRVLLHVIVRDGEPGKDKAIPATIAATATRKDRSQTTIILQKTESNGEVFYLGDISITKSDALNFEIMVDVPNTEPMRMTFFQEFYSQ